MGTANHINVENISAKVVNLTGNNLFLSFYFSILIENIIIIEHGNS
jgi:hypothetical protein